MIFHKKNQGVGGATISGLKRALSLGADYVVKIDGDGQMDASRMEDILKKLDDGYDYAKGNRFRHFSSLRKMPKIRLFGNSALSFLVKAVSGYWNIMDPTNGYLGISSKALKEIELSSIAKDYFFETDMLINLNIIGATVTDVPIPARYGDEKSSLSISKTLKTFPSRLIKGLFRRIFIKYYIYDFNMFSVYFATGLPLFLFGITWGGFHWVDSIITNSSKPTGTIMVATLCTIMGFQLLLQAINIDMGSTSRKDKP